MFDKNTRIWTFPMSFVVDSALFGGVVLEALTGILAAAAG
jgi:hypothetical protein